VFHDSDLAIQTPLGLPEATGTSVVDDLNATTKVSAVRQKKRWNDFIF
jgi:hypothetical protein